MGKSSRFAAADAERTYDVMFEWGLQGLAASGAEADVIVVVDVLSFTTAVEVATSQGGAVFPYPSDSEGAAAFAATVGAELAVNRSEVGPWQPYSLSPASLFDLPSRHSVVLPSPHGSTIALEATAGTRATVIAGCLRNASAVAKVARDHGGATLVLACGERWNDGSLRPALEDLLGAGAIIRAMADRYLSAEARVAAETFHSETVGDLIAQCQSGRELLDAGYGEDVGVASVHDVSQTVPLLTTGAFRAAASLDTKLDQPRCPRN